MRKAKNFQIERDSLNSYGDENDYREDDEIFDEIDYPQSPNERWAILWVIETLFDCWHAGLVLHKGARLLHSL